MANPSVHLTNLFKNVVKMTTKIYTHMLKLIHDGSKRCLYFRRRSGANEEEGMMTYKCVRMRVITEGKMSLSRVVVP